MNRPNLRKIFSAFLGLNTIQLDAGTETKNKD